ncbi:solute carrier family 22 member 2-like [Takifugu rubripes]|nr:solute carrier family 22 member 2-like [Takifugu rubripes]|eukprot:XP_003971522.2 PREDICTED: solute carrier family 22 member 2-like [Takifugu rubripes]
MTTFDDILEEVGPFARFQKRIFLLLSVSSLSIAGFLTSIVFLGYTPDHWCRDSAVAAKRQECDWSLEHTRRLTVPYSNTSGPLENMCTQYDLDWNTTALSCSTETLNLTGVPVTACKEGWEFDYEGRKSFVTEFTLVCSDAWLADMYQSSLGVGFLFGSVAFGYFSDKYGRKLTIVLANMMNFIMGIAVAVIPNYTCILLFRAFLGFSMKGSWMSSYVLISEVVGMKNRRFVGIMYQVFLSFALLIVPLLAYLITDWRWLQVVITAPTGMFLVYYWFVPESPRWLLSQKKFPKALEITKAIAKENKKKFSSNFEALTTDDDEGDAPSASILDLFRTPNMRKYTLILMYIWLTTEVVYQGLIMRVGIARGNLYIDFLISSLMELPACLFILFTVERMGRRIPFCAANIVTGLACLITAFIPENMYWFKTVVGSIGRLTVTMAVEMVVFVNTELFPTCVRNLGVSFCSTSCDIGSIVAPFVLYRLATVWNDLPLIIFGGITLVGGGLILLLPETKGVPLPETIDDIEFPNRKKKAEEKIAQIAPLNAQPC